MDNMFFAENGSASAWASVRLYALGFVGTVRFAVDSKHGTAVRHECLRFRDNREQALDDARSDARKLVKMWVEDQVRLGDL